MPKLQSHQLLQRATSGQRSACAECCCRSEWPLPLEQTASCLLSGLDLGLEEEILVPRKQKIGVKTKIVFKKVKLEKNADNFGREYWGGGLKPWKNKADKFAEKNRHQNSLRNSPEIFLKFAKQKKIHPNPPAEPWVQEIRHLTSSPARRSIGNIAL